MGLLGRYGNWLAQHAGLAIAIVIGITVVMGYYTTQVDMGFSDDDFQPDNEVGKANTEVRDDFGGTGASISVMVLADENILSRTSLEAQLDLQERVAADPVIAEVIATDAENPDGFTSPAELVAQAAVLDRVLASMETLFEPTATANQTMAPPAPNESAIAHYQGALAAQLANLTIDQMRTTITGGTITMMLPADPPTMPVSVPITLSFDPYEPQLLAEYLNGSPVAAGFPFLLSNDYSNATFTASKAFLIVAIDPELTDAEQLTVERALEQHADAVESDADGIEFRVLGDQLISEAINDATGQTMGLLMTLAFGFVIVILIIIYRSVVDTILNLLALVMAIVWVFGLAGVLGFRFNPAITTVPVLIIGLGIDYGIHITLRYKEELRRGRSIREGITRAESSVGLAILLATVTTIIGFSSNLSADTSTIRQFGVLSAVGIASAFIIMITFFPAAKSLVDRRREKRGKPLVRPKRDRKPPRWWPGRQQANGTTDTGINDELVCESGVACINHGIGLGALAARKPWLPIIAVVGLTIAGTYGAVQLEPRFDFRDFLPADLEVTDTVVMSIEEFSFSSEQAYILVEGDVADPAVYRALDEAGARAQASDYAVLSEPLGSPSALVATLTDPTSFRYEPSVAAVWGSTADRDGDGQLDANATRAALTAVYDELYRVVPEDAQRVLRHSGAGGDGSIKYDGALLRVPVNSQNGKVATGVRDDMLAAAAPVEELEGTALDRAIVTGGPVVQAVVFEDISEGQLRSLLITFFVSLGILTVLYAIIRKSLLLGVVTMLPLVFVISWTLGTMYLLGIPLNVVTVTIAAITVGIGIDYSIHLTQRFLEDKDRFKDGSCAICVSVRHTGTALFGSALTTVAGFGILSLAIIPPLAQFGQVTAISVAFSFLASVFVLPTFLLLWSRLRDRVLAKKEKSEPTEGADLANCAAGVEA